MPVTKTWSNPEAAVGSGGLDVATGGSVSEAWGDRLASNLDWVAGTAGVINQAGIAVGSTSNPTTTSTSYVDMTDMSVTITPEVGSTRILAILGSTVSNSGANTVNIALSLDGAGEVAPRQHLSTDANDQSTLTTFYLWTGVSAAAHTIKGRWVVSAGTGTLTTVMRTLVVLQLK